MKIEFLNKKLKDRAFCSGESETDDFWRDRAYTEQMLWRCGTTKVLLEDDDILGFYTLAMQTLSLKYGEEGYPKDRKVSSVLIGQLAVDKKHQKKGYSRILLKSALSDIIEVDKKVGVYIITVDAVNEQKVFFWEKFGFKRYSENSLRLFYPMKNLL